MNKLMLPWLIAGISVVSLIVVLVNRETCVPCTTTVAQTPAAVSPEPAPIQPVAVPPVAVAPRTSVAQKSSPVIVPVKQPQQMDIGLTAEVQRITLKIKASQLASGPSRITVREGQAIELTVIADKVGELYLEGYEISTALYPNQRTVVAFKTDMTGRFNYVHTISGNTLGVLEVLSADE